MMEQDKVIGNVCAHMGSYDLDKCMLLDGDDLTPPWPGSPAGLDKLRKLAAFPNIEFSTPHRFFEDVDLDRPGLRVLTGELVSTTGDRHNNVGAYTTFAEIKRRNRASEWGLRTAEALAAVSLDHGGEYPIDRLSRAWRLALFNQMHDILPGTAVFEAYDEAHRRYDEVDAVCVETVQAATNVIAHRVDTRGAAGAGDSIPVLLFNTLSCERSDPAEIVLTEPHSYFEEFEAVDGNGRNVPTQVLSSTLGTFDKTNKTYKVLAMPESVPAMGYRTIWLRPVAARRPVGQSMAGADGLSLENEFARVRIDPRTGWVAEYYDKRLMKSVIPDGQQACVLEGCLDMGNPWHLAPEGETWTLNETVQTEVVEDGEVRAAIRVTTTWHKSTFLQEFRLTRNSPRLEVRTEVDCHDPDMVCKMLLPLALPVDATWTSEVPWGAAVRDIPDNDRAAHTWTDVSSDGWGVSLLNDGRYGHSRREDGTLTLTLLRSVKAHLSSDQTDEGHHEVTYAILPHAGDWTDSDTIRDAHALNAPMVALRDIPHDGELPTSASKLSVEPANVVLGALKRAEDDDAWIVHLYEATGHATDAALTFDRTVSEATEIDMIEWEQGAKVEADGTTVRRSFRAWEIVALRVRFV
jgi:alpha-mannosidase